MIKIDPEKIATTPLGSERLPCGCELNDTKPQPRPFNGTNWPEPHRVTFCGNGESCVVTGLIRGFFWRARHERLAAEARK